MGSCFSTQPSRHHTRATRASATGRGIARPAAVHIDPADGTPTRSSSELSSPRRNLDARTRPRSLERLPTVAPLAAKDDPRQAVRLIERDGHTLLAEDMRIPMPFRYRGHEAIHDALYRVPQAQVAQRFEDNLSAAIAQESERENDRWRTQPSAVVFPGTWATPIGEYREHDFRHDYGGMQIRHAMLAPDLGVAHSPGSRAKKREDRHLDDTVIYHGQLLKLRGVLDGHGGDACAEFAATHLAERIGVRLHQCNPVELTPEGIDRALKWAMVDVHLLFTGEKSGSTACITLEVPPSDKLPFPLVCANVGDSYGLSTADRVVPFTEDADPYSERYQKGSTKLGKTPFVVTLGTERALGNHHFNGQLSPRPKNTLPPVPDDGQVGHVVLCSDGILGSRAAIGAHVARRVAQGVPLNQIAAEIVAASEQGGGSDDMTCLIQAVSRPPKPKVVTGDSPASQLTTR